MPKRETTLARLFLAPVLIVIAVVVLYPIFIIIGCPSGHGKFRAKPLM